MTMVNVEDIALANMKLKHLTIRKTVEATAKTLNLSDADKRELEGALVEYVVGIWGDDDTQQHIDAKLAVSLFEEAVLCAERGSLCTLGGKSECDAQVAKETLRNYLVVSQMGW